jgi:VIT1/CCC1 family predicted Fe2+/Mn2+ transporter
MNGTPMGLLADRQRSQAYPPNGRPRGYPLSNSGPMPAYSPPNGRPAPGYPPPNGTPPNGSHVRPAPGYPLADRQRPQAYPPNGRPRGYPPNGRPAPGYPPPNGTSNGTPSNGAPPNGRPRGYPLSNSGPMPAYSPGHGRPAPVYPPPNGTPPNAAPPNGTRIMGWLPFGQRLVFLPKGTFEDEELREHRDVSGGWLRPAVFGAMDGLVTNSSLIAGIGGGGGGHGAIALTGIAGLIAGAFSMATGEYISVKSQNELTLAEVDLERKQHVRDPAGKLKRLTEVYIDKGVSPNLAEAVVRQISADQGRAVATHVREELGIDPDDLPSPQTAAIASFLAFTVGALIPLAPFLLGYPVLKAALIISGAAAFVGGAAVAKLTGRSMILGGLRQFTAAALATGMAFVIGHLVGGHVSA